MASVLFAVQNDNDTFVPVSNQESSSSEDKDNFQARSNWDSGEYYYFQWANKNRRPIEYFPGRKRATDKVIIPLRARRINGGLWRSGLVG